MPRATAYAHRKAARLCQDCAAGLQEADGLRCVECTATRAKATTSPRAHRRRAAWRRARYRRGLCQDCPAPTVPGRCRCAEHLAARTAAFARYLDRKEAADVAA